MTEEEKFKIYLRILNEENSIDKKEEAMLGLLGLYYKQQTEIEELKDKNASQEKQIKLMQSCDLAKVIKKQEREIEELKNGQIDFWISDKEIEERIKNKFISKDKIREHLKKFEEIEKEFIFIDNKSTAREINKALIEFSKRLLEE